MKAKCPCGYMLKLKPEHAGKKVKCPKCGQISRIPESLGKKAKKPEAPAAPPEDSPITQGDLTAQQPEPDPFAQEEESGDPFAQDGEAGMDTMASFDLDFGGQTQGPATKDSSSGLDFDFGSDFGEDAEQAASSPGGGTRLGFEEDEEDEDSFSTAQGTVSASTAGAPDSNYDFDMGSATLEDEEVLELNDAQILEMNVGGTITRPALSTATGPAADTDIASMPAAPAAPAAPASDSWWHYLAHAWGHPFKGISKWMVIGYAPLAAIVTRFLLPIMPGIIFQFVLLALVYGIYWSFVFQTIASAAAEPEREPDPPDLTDFWGSCARPLFLIIFTVGGAFLLMFIVSLVSKALPQGVQSIVGIGFLALMLLYWPLALLCAGVTDSFAACWPFFVLKSLPTILPGYILVAFITNVLAGAYVGAMVAQFVGSVLAIESALLGFLVKILVTMVSFYLVLVMARLLGTFYYCKSERFKW